MGIAPTVEATRVNDDTTAGDDGDVVSEIASGNGGVAAATVPGLSPGFPGAHADVTYQYTGSLFG